MIDPPLRAISSPPTAAPSAADRVGTLISMIKVAMTRTDEVSAPATAPSIRAAIEQRGVYEFSPAAVAGVGRTW